MTDFGVVGNLCHYQLRDGYLDEMLDASAEVGVEWLCLNGGGARWRQHGNDGVMAAAEMQRRVPRGNVAEALGIKQDDA